MDPATLIFLLSTHQSEGVHGHPESPASLGLWLCIYRHPKRVGSWTSHRIDSGRLQRRPTTSRRDDREVTGGSRCPPGRRPGVVETPDQGPLLRGPAPKNHSRQVGFEENRGMSIHLYRVRWSERGCTLNAMQPWSFRKAVESSYNLHASQVDSARSILVPKF